MSKVADYEVDIVVIGAGVVGLAITNELLNYYDNVLLVEKEPTFGRHVSSRNSEVIHSGIYYDKDSLKARLCVEGNQLLYEFAEKYNIEHKKCGKFILAQNQEEAELLGKLLIKGRKNGVKGLRPVTAEEVFCREPLIGCMEALFVKSAGIISAHEVMQTLERLIKQRSELVVYNTEVVDIKYDKDYVVTLSDECTVKAKAVVNSAGLWSDKVAQMVGMEEYELSYCKGEYYKTNKYRNEINTLIYPTPTPISLGTHIVIKLDGTISFGPNAYYVDNIDYSMDDSYKEDFYQKVNQYLKLDREDLTEEFSGIRPKLQKDGEPVKDFIIKDEVDKGFPNFINLIGIESPGLTSSLAIGKYVSKMLKGDK